MPRLVLLAALAVSACSSPPVGVAAELPGSSWTVERVVLPDGSVLRGEGQVTFGADGALTMASCNQCSGRYSIRDSVLTVEEPLACTKRACAPGAMELERHLGGVSTVRRDGSYLVAEPLAEGAARVLLVPANAGTGEPAAADRQ